MSDTKTRAGINRIDDRKRSIDQVLRLGVSGNSRRVRIAIVYHVQASRHEKEFVSPIEDILCRRAKKIFRQSMEKIYWIGTNLSGSLTKLYLLIKYF